MNGLKHELNTREKILYAAKREFLDKGFAGTNVRTVAQKAGVTTGALYNLFKNKNGIFEALVDGVKISRRIKFFIHVSGSMM